VLAATELKIMGIKLGDNSSGFHLTTALLRWLDGRSYDRPDMYCRCGKYRITYTKPYGLGEIETYDERIILKLA
jgi:hypothetical protein